MIKEPKIHILRVRIPLHQLNTLERKRIETGRTHSAIIRELIDQDKKTF